MTGFADLLGRHALALVLVTFGAVLLVTVLALGLGRWSWRHRTRVWSLVARPYRRVARRPAVRRLARRHPRLFGFLRHFTVTEFLEAYLLGGLLVSLGVMGFVALAQRVGRPDLLVRFDHDLATALHQAWSPGTLGLLGLVTTLGSGPALSTIGVGVTLILALRRRTSLVSGWVLALVGAGLLNLALKAIFQRLRPEYADVGGWSFPSGHAMGSLVTYGMLAYLAHVHLPRWPARLVAAGLLLLVLLIGVSRLYLGEHYLSDVVAGYAAAAVWLAACVTGVEIARRRDARGAGISGRILAP